ncbi:hypothetical protein AB0L53_34670 [Nonomuraea sp. NPDC052129]
MLWFVRRISDGALHIIDESAWMLARGHLCKAIAALQNHRVAQAA